MAEPATIPPGSMAGHGGRSWRGCHGRVPLLTARTLQAVAADGAVIVPVLPARWLNR